MPMYVCSSTALELSVVFSNALKKQKRNSSVGDFVKRVLRGDPQAVDLIIKETQNDLIKFCFGLTGNMHEAEELAQEAYIKAFASLKTLKEPTKFYSWVVKISKNIYIDRTRSTDELGQNRTIREIEPGALLGVIEDMGSSNPEELAAVQNVLNLMDPDDKVILLLAHHQELQGPEIAELINIQAGAVRARLARARQEFIRIYEDQGE